MSESTLMTLLAIILGIGVIYFFLDRMSNRFSDARFKNLWDYVLIFKKGLEILNARRWLVFIPLGIALFAYLVKFVFYLKATNFYATHYLNRSFVAFLFSGAFHSLYYFIDIIKKDMIYVAVNSFFFVGPFNVQFAVWFYSPLAYALILLFGAKRISKALNHIGDRLPRFFHNSFYPSIGSSILVLFIYGTLLFEAYRTSDPFADRLCVWLAYLFGHIGLGGLFFAFFVGLLTYAVYQDYSSDWIYKPINWDQVLANAEQLLFFWVFVSFLALPPVVHLFLPLWGKTLFTSPLFSFLPVLVSLLLMFVPMIIVVKKEKFVKSLLLCFGLWKVEYPRIIIFLIIAGVLSTITQYFVLVLSHLIVYPGSLLDIFFTSISICIAVFVQIWIMVSGVGFFQKLNPDKDVSLSISGLDEELSTY